MPFWRRKKNRIPFHVTDVENFYSALRDGNSVSALRYGVRVLDRGLNGPTLKAGDRNAFEEYDYSEEDQKKMGEISQKLQQLIDEQEVRVGREQLQAQAKATEKETEVESTGKPELKTGKHPPVTTRKDAATKESNKEASKRNEVPADQKKPDGTPAKEPVKDEDEGVPGIDPQAPLSAPNLMDAHDNLVGAVPWVLIMQMAMAIMQMISQWKQQNP